MTFLILIKWPISMDDSFNIHLISNVSPDTFPNNNPAKFSTILADEIELKSGQWEVGVQQIMYPTKVDITTEDKKIFIFKNGLEERFEKLLPFPKENNPQTLFNTGIKFNWNFRYKPTDEKLKVAEDLTVKFILNVVNGSKWKHIVRMDYKKSTKLFGIHLYHDDIIFLMDRPLSKLLGFKRDCYTKGTYWSESPLTLNTLSKLTDDVNLNAFLIDLQVLEKGEEQLMKSEVSEKVAFVKNYEYQLADDSNKQHTVKFSFAVHPQEGYIKINPPKNLPASLKQHEKKVIFFRFDDKTRRKLNLERIYCPYQKLKIKIPPIPIKQGEKSILDTVKSITVEFFYLSLRVPKRHLALSPTDTILIAECQLQCPKDLLLKLNKKSKKYLYEYTYNEILERYELAIKSDDYVLVMNKSLAILLGFNPYQTLYTKNDLYRGTESPTFKNSISALYIYSNIIDSVYVGDVKAPLLLTCPFQRADNINLVNQLEFINPTYVPVNRQNLRQIDIAIYDDVGKSVPFLNGKTKLNLHFRKRN